MKKNDTFYLAARIHGIEAFLRNLENDPAQSTMTKSMASSLRSDAGWIKCTINQEVENRLNRTGG